MNNIVHTIIIKESEQTNPLIDAIVDVYLFTNHTDEQLFAELENIQDEFENQGKFYNYFVYKNNKLMFAYENGKLPMITF